MDGQSQDQLLHILETADYAEILFDNDDPLAKVLRLLVESPDSREVDTDGNGAFHQVVRSGVLEHKDVATVTALVQGPGPRGGGDLELRDILGQTPLFTLIQ